MHKLADFLDDINAKYSSKECFLDAELKRLSAEEQKIVAAGVVAEHNSSVDTVRMQPKFCTNLVDAQQRNAELIRELEISKARLRSRATYSPLELELTKAIANYNQQRALEPISKKFYGPTYI